MLDFDYLVDEMLPYDSSSTKENSLFGVVLN